MIVKYLDYAVGTILPDLLVLLDSLMIVEGVSWLGLVVAVILLCIIIGSIVMRVS